jgi:acyl dehydratase
MNSAQKTKYQVTVGDSGAADKTITFEQIEVGDELPPYTKWITMQSAIRFGKTYKDVFSGHVNSKVSEGQFGVGSMPVQGAVIESGVTPMIVNWLRSTRPWLYGGRQESKFIQIVVPGDTLRYHGTVLEKTVEGDVRYAKLEIYAENQRNEKVMVGFARVAFGPHSAAADASPKG